MLNGGLYIDTVFFKMKNKSEKTSPFAIRNIRLFLAFRICFNSRFYYPVFSIFFLDFGLTLSQFAILNSVWAGTIVLCEVPSGALADTIGRRNLLIFSGILMILEMTLLAFAPRENIEILFLFILVNRILSGMAEASASGADEALAYDSLSKEGNIKDWGMVLEKQMRLQSIGFIIVMILGGMVYDPDLMGKVAHWLGFNITITKDVTLRFPVYLTIISAIFTLIISLMMEEVSNFKEECKQGTKCVSSIVNGLKITFQAGRWILNTPFVLIAILMGLIFDSVIRMVITMSSQYYRMIEIPEAMFGIIGSAVAMLGLFIPSIARRLVQNHTPFFNLGFTTVLTMSGLIGMSFFFPLLGLLPALVLFSNMYFIGFFLSHYLNRATHSEQRATVLSFKGLSFNLGYGLIGIMYSILLSFLRDKNQIINPYLEGEALKNTVFMESMLWFPWYFGLSLAALMIFAVWKLKHSDEFKRVDYPSDKRS
jgi:MFS family permease